MTIQPVAPPHLLTAAEYLEIGESELACHLAGEFGQSSRADPASPTAAAGATPTTPAARPRRRR